MISDILRDFADALQDVWVGSTAIDSGSEFFGDLLDQAADFIETAFGS